MQVPWAAPQGRFTLLFERFAVEVLLASGSVSQACELLGLNWDTAQEIMRRRLTGPTDRGAPFLAVLYLKDGRHEHLLYNTLGPTEIWAFSTTVASRLR